MARTGRRKGNPGTREAILAAARDAFAERGYDKATIRQIAAGAVVDPALVHHYFGTKEQLFLATVEAPFDPTKLLPEILGFSGFSWRPPTVISGRSYQPAWAVTASPIASLPMIGRHRHTSNKLPGHCTRRRPLIGGVRNPV